VVRSVNGETYLAGIRFATAIAGLVCVGAAGAQNYPAKPIRLILPTAAGGSLDSVGRVIAQKFTEQWGQQVVVDNRPGAGGMLGTETAARAAPDGYTLLIASNGNLATTQALYKKVPYDPVRDFAPVVLMTETPYIVVVHPSLPVKTVAELIQLAKVRPGQLNYASSGSGSTPHLAGELFKSMAGINLVHVPYKGSPAALTSLLSGETVVGITGMPSSWAQVKAGRIRALGVAGTRRSTTAPELPTVTESGLPGYEVNSWSGLLAPAATPKSVIAALNAEVMKILALPDVRQQLLNQGFEVLGGTPEQFGVFIKAEIVKWTRVIRDAGAHVD
jgi:tripartite-type tricarboxylate transporter receptor subunit TctC